MAVLREGVSGEALHSQDALSPCREQLAGSKRKTNPSVVRLGEHAIGFTLQTLLSLAPKLKPATGQKDGITQAEIRVHHRVRSNSPKEKNC